MANKKGKWNQWLILFYWSSKSLWMVTAAKQLKTLLGKKVMTNLDSVLKNRDITLLTKVHLVKTMVFPVTMYGCESWTIKCWEPVWGTLPMAKVMRKEARHTQRRDRASGAPWKSWSIYPHNQSLPTLLLCALTYTSDFTGGCPPPPLSEKELT